MGLSDRYRVPGDPVLPPRAAVASSRPVVVRQTLRERLSSGEVEWSQDFARILALPRRPRPEDWPAWADELERLGHPLAAQIRRGVAALVEEMTQRLKRPGGTQTLREIQALTLWEAEILEGVVGLIRTGGGKSLIGMLMPMVMPHCKRAVLLLPPDLRPQFYAEWTEYAKHWTLPNLAGGDNFVVGRPVLHVVAYSEFSHQKASALLDQIDPDTILADEMSALRNPDSARGRRFYRCFEARPNTRFCGWDATAVADSITDFWHLLGFALGSGSPIPINVSEVRRWAKALDPNDRDGYFMPGVLQQFCEPGESVRSGFQRRLVNTPGVIVTEENLLGIPLYFEQRTPPPMPESLVKHLHTLRRRTDDGGWKRPDGEELRTPVEVVACAKQLAEGFWLYWKFLEGTNEQIDLWFQRRQDWNRELRAVLQNSYVHMDSPALCENAAKRFYDGGCPGCSRSPREPHGVDCRVTETHPLWPSMTYLGWREVEDSIRYTTAVKWESTWLLEDVALWACEAPGIVWVDHPEFGHKLAQLTGLPYYGGGSGHDEILTADGSTSIICSVAANKRGKNLQLWARNLVVSFPSSNDILEQMVGRTYREGQKAPHVEVFYYLHTSELERSLEIAQERAKFVAETTGAAQKLCYATFRRAA